MIERLLLLAALLWLPVARASGPDALLVIIADSHSAYDKVPQLLGRIDQLQAENPGVPLATLVDGDAFEYGNVLARRTEGALDFAMFSALRRRGPVVLNLGNHEADLFGLPDVIGRLQALGVTVIGGNARNRETGQPFGPAFARLRLGREELTLVGVTTDLLATFRVAVRPTLDLADPVTWARANFPVLFKGASRPVVLSHAGLNADRKMFELVPERTLFVGAHDHLQLLRQERNLTYLHTGCWLEGVATAALFDTASGPQWSVSYAELSPAGPVDAGFAALVRKTMAEKLTRDETETVGSTSEPLSPAAAARFAVEAARRAAGADVAIIGGTTFGAGLPGGVVTRYAFDSFVRFDGPLFVGEIDGVALRILLARCNQGADTPFAERTGENLVASFPGAIVAGKRYQLATSDWIARNPARYFGHANVVLKELPGVRLKASVLKALQDPAAR